MQLIPVYLYCRKSESICKSNQKINIFDNTTDIPYDCCIHWC